MKHITKDGRKIELCDLDTEHLENILRLIKKRAKEGIKVTYGGGFDADEMWYDETILTGKKARKKLGYYHYRKELLKRGQNEFNSNNS